MPNQNNVPKDMVSQHKTNLLLTGELSDFQLENIKTWPMILFEDLEKVVINYNFKLKEDDDSSNALGLHAGTVEYDFEFKKNTRIPKNRKEQRLAELTFWTRFLFWNDTEVIFKRKGKRWS